MKKQLVLSLSLALLATLICSTRAESEYAATLLAPYLDTPTQPPATTSFGKLAFGASSTKGTSATAPVFAASASASASVAANNANSRPSPPPPSARARAKVSAAVQIARDTQCNPNVCFALSATGRLSDADFEQQQHFVKLVSAIISLHSGASFAATQYARRARRISALTDDVDAFLRRVDRARRRCPCNGRPRVRASVSMCARLLRNAGGVRKIVVLGDGRGGVGGRTAKSFLTAEGTGVCGVQVAGSEGAMERAAGEGVHVVSIGGWNELVDIVDELVSAVCGTPSNF
eukprot:TRINITY_DN3873_c0_g2_i1.p2 TRINITY_DN3873_c0_g2~~TRINITY_DN3873_c0_g2_i1.p2  ORF type:complete len:290 (+),score=51.88 TRINITY_DN3873_c0_g2_i1:223-1092(+)